MLIKIEGCFTSERSGKKTTRSKRSTYGTDLYKALASATGGSVYITDKGGISKLANIISVCAYFNYKYEYNIR